MSIAQTLGTKISNDRRSGMSAPVGFHESSGMLSFWKISRRTRGNAVAASEYVRCTETGESSWSNDVARPSAEIDGPNPQPRCASRFTKCGASQKLLAPSWRLSSRSERPASANGWPTVSTSL